MKSLSITYARSGSKNWAFCIISLMLEIKRSYKKVFYFKDNLDKLLGWFRKINNALKTCVQFQVVFSAVLGAGCGQFVIFGGVF